MRVTFHNLDTIGGSAWEQARGYLREELERLQATINTTWTVAHDVDGTQNAASRALLAGSASGTLAEQPLGLTIDDAGYIFDVTDFGHRVKWSGALWGFAPGDNGSGYFDDFAITPQASGWALCDGSTVSYLVVGGVTLTTANIVLPNLSGSAAYRKSAAAYTGTIVAAAGSSGTGTTGGTSPATDAQGGHTHTFTSGGPDSTGPLTAGGAQTYSTGIHVHSGTTAADGSHTHTVDSHTHTAPALGVGTLDMAHLNVLPYFRR
jgi:hypothetical protein